MASLPPAVDALAAAVAAATGAVPASAKLRATAVSVLSRGGGGGAGRWRKDADAAAAALAADAPDAAAFMSAVQGARERGTPHLDEFLVTLHSIAASPAVRAALVCEGGAIEADAAWAFEEPPAAAAAARPPSAPRVALPSEDEEEEANDDDDDAMAEASPSPSTARSPPRTAARPPPSSSVGPLHGRPAAPSPRDPAWFHDRPRLAGCGPAVPSPGDGVPRPRAPPPLAALPPDAAEAAAVDDLLTALLGVSGTWIVARAAADEHGEPGVAFGWSDGARSGPGGGVPPSLADRVAPLLPLAAAAADVGRFAHAWSAAGAGGAGQGAAAAARAVFAEWAAHVARLDHARRSGTGGRGGLTLAALTLHVAAPAPALLETAAAARAVAAARATGGALVDLLAARAAAAAGDPPRAGAAGRLLAGAAGPLCAALTAFVADGPSPATAELPFLDNPAALPGRPTPDGRDALWAARLTVARGPGGGPPLVPRCLAPVAPRALAAARCLLAVRACPGAPPPRVLPPGEVLAYDDGGALAGRVAAAADAAAAALWAVVRSPPPATAAPALAAALDAVRTFLLGDRADLTASLFDAVGEARGGRPAASVRPAALDAALDAALRATGLSAHPAAAALTLTLDPRSVLGRLRDAREAGATAAGEGGPSLARGGGGGAGDAAAAPGALRATPARDALALALALPFPTSILLPPCLTAAAALVWRHAADLACARRALAAAAAALAPARGLRGRPSPALAALLAHRAWMDAALAALEAHAAVDVCGPAWRALRTALCAPAAASNPPSQPDLDAALAAGDAFTRALLTGALLSRRVKLARAVADIKTAAARFGRALATGLADAAGDAFAPLPPHPPNRRSSVGGLAVDAPLPPAVGAVDPAAAATARSDAAAAQAARLDARAGAADVVAAASEAAAAFRRRVADLAAGAAAAAAAAGPADDGGEGRAEADALAKLAARLAPVVGAACAGKQWT